MPMHILSVQTKSNSGKEKNLHKYKYFKDSSQFYMFGCTCTTLLNYGFISRDLIPYALELLNAILRFLLTSFLFVLCDITWFNSHSLVFEFFPLTSIE